MNAQTVYRYLVAFVAASALCGLLYISVQQEYRQSANDPQIQMAEDISARISHGEPVEGIVSSRTVNIADSLAPFLIIYDQSGNPVVSSAVLDGNIPVLPQGVIAYTGANGEDRITWQPKAGVRVAAVIEKTGGNTTYYVLAGRSLREVEKREDRLFQFILIGWLSLTCMLVLYFFITPQSYRNTPAA